MKQSELDQILNDHKLWLNGAGGQRANLRGANLRGANLRGANLYAANLTDANLRGANLTDAYLYAANLTDANLRGANLTDAYLYAANLTDANLWSTIGNKCEIKSLQLEGYDITYTAEVIQIGCQRHTIEQWANFNDYDIQDMDDDALAWWVKWKEFIFQAIELSPAEASDHE